MRIFSEVILGESVHSRISELIFGDSDGACEGVAVDSFLRFSLSIILGFILGFISGFILGFIVGFIPGIVLGIIFRFILRFILRIILSLRIDLWFRFRTTIYDRL